MFPYLIVGGTFACLFGGIVLLGLGLAREVWANPEWGAPETRDADRAATRSASVS